eukprot:m.22137 g.22137  ORF g.22137 m.22137 type:complete len:213 (+) comp7351_c0_seq1:178-816(+)
MKIKRAKQARRVLNLYKNGFGIEAPYRMILDGTFCHAVLSCKISAREQIPSYLGSSCSLFTTKCVVAELETLGEDFRGAKLFGKRLERKKCAHKGTVSAAECLSYLIGSENRSKYLVGTQDPELRRKFRKIPGVPLMVISSGVLFLEKPSSETMSYRQEVTEGKLVTAEKDKKKLEDLKGPQEIEEPKPRKRKAKGPNPLSVRKKKKGKQNT